MSDDIELELDDMSNTEFVLAQDSWSQLDAHSTAWTNIIHPYAKMFSWLIILVILLPFFFVECSDAGPTTKLEPFMAWGNTVLSPVVGFATAILGYYFGRKVSNS